MNRNQLEEKIHKSASAVLAENGYISPIDVLIKMDRLTVKQVEDWRFKRTDYLERAINLNLAKLNHFLQALKKYAKEQNLKPSITVYKSWGKGAKKTLRFSKTGKPNMEKLYSTHYVKQSGKKEKPNIKQEENQKSSL
ncbi:hypothetical protein [Oceanobacillus sojae]|uniref:hypothetical protein n=1 Tax=Oceanobacillus sojae TaxID=582851 RepID=UPI00158F0610|nr:hypothetical protein [Oceanobacillus sojae]